MNHILFYSCGIGFVLGIFCRSLLVYSLLEILWGGVITFGLVLLWQRKNEVFSLPHIRAVLFFALFFLLGSLRMDFALLDSPSMLRTLVGEKVTLEGVVVSPPDVRESTQQLTVAVEEEKVLVSTEPYTKYGYGDTVEVSGTLAVPEVFETESLRVFDYPKYLMSRGISYTLAFAEVTVQSSGGGNPVVRHLLTFKESFVARIQEHIPHPESALANGLLLGIKQGLGDTLEEAFRTTGIMHIVVLSGYNMMLVVQCISLVLALFFSQRVQIAFGVMGIIAFTLMVGLGASVVRASAMAILVLLAQATGRTYTVLRALMLVGVAMLIANPYLLVYDVGFQLSFLATFGLIMGAPLVERFAHRVPTFLKLREFFVATVAVQIFVTPLLLYQIGEFSSVAVLVNMLVLPMVAPAMLLTFLTGVSAFVFPHVSVLLGYVAYLSLSYIIAVALFFSSLPLSAFVVPVFPFWLLVAMYAVLAYLLWRSLRTKDSVHPQARETPFSQWTIVEENEFVEQVSKKKKEVSNEIPIFFR